MIFGVAVNDLPEHKTQIVEYYSDINGKRKRKVVWTCPFYSRWFNMLTRCYCPKELARHPSYDLVTVCSDWLYFSKFKDWMENQDWQGNQLDKDLINPGNKVYCPENCCFISGTINKFVLEKKLKGDFPTGVSFHKKKKKFIASIGAGSYGKIKHIGSYDSPQKARIAYLQAKLEAARALCEGIADERIKLGLLRKYEDLIKAELVEEVNCEHP